MKNTKREIALVTGTVSILAVTLLYNAGLKQSHWDDGVGRYRFIGHSWDNAVLGGRAGGSAYGDIELSPNGAWGMTLHRAGGRQGGTYTITGNDITFYDPSTPGPVFTGRFDPERTRLILPSLKDKSRGMAYEKIP